ncbi:MAG: (2Fe-2S)-binding protein [Prosthecochloris sp.]|nr:(2Fe-2S)-binding protein [Prosthecochloris sp.]
MRIDINNRSYEAQTGERLIDVARRNHTHIGYFCGGNGICQTCYVKVLKGMDLLSPVSDREKALLSDDLLEEGIRVACLTTIEKPGTVELLTTVEEVKRMVEKRPQDIVGYQARMGIAALVKFPDTIAMQAKRFSEGKLDTFQLFTDIVTAIGDAVSLTVKVLTQGWGPSETKPEFTRQYVHGETGPEHNSREKITTCRAVSAQIPQQLKLEEKTPVN